MTINFLPSKDVYEKHLMHSKSNDGIMINNKIYKFIDELFPSLLHSYQVRLEEAMESSDLVIR